MTHKFSLLQQNIIFQKNQLIKKLKKKGLTYNYFRLRQELINYLRIDRSYDQQKIFDDHVYEDIELELGDEIIKKPQIKEMRYKFGNDKFIVIEKKFEDWVNEIK